MTQEHIRRMAEAAVLNASKEARPGRPVLHVCGLNHMRAQLDLREQYALSPEQVAALVRKFLSTGFARQVMVLSTCNRTEIFAFGERADFALELREAFLALGSNIDTPAGPPPIHEYEGIDAVRHLFAVSAGLDSMILGENQIKQQIQQAYEICRAEGASGPEMSRLVEAAHRAGKRIRTETGLNAGTLCVGKAAVLKCEHVLGSIEGKVCMVIGAGKVGKIAARAIAERHPGRLWIVNRTVEKAMEVAEGLGAEAYALEDLHCLLPEAEFILGAAYADELILDRALYERHCPPDARPARVCMIDAAVPRILDPALAQVEGVELYDIEHMQEITEENHRRRLSEAHQAWQIVEEEVKKFQAALKAADLAPVIQKLHGGVDRIFGEELASMAPECTTELLGKIEGMHHRIKQRLMHEVIQEMKSRLIG